MIEIYDAAGALVGRSWSYSDMCIERSVDAPPKMSLTYRQSRYASPYVIRTDYRLVTERDAWVVRRVEGSRSTGLKISCDMDDRLLRRSLYRCIPDADVAAQTIDERWNTFVRRTTTETYYVNRAKAWAKRKIAGDIKFYWTVDGSAIASTRTMAPENFSQRSYLDAMRVAYMCEAEWDSKNRAVKFVPRLGSDKGTYMRAGFTVSRVNKTTDTYDLATAIVPTGKDGLSIATAGGASYSGCAHAPGSYALTCHDYSDAVAIYQWQDESYTDAEELAADAGRLLADMAKPAVTYSVTPVGIQRSDDGTYTTRDWEIGDVVTIVDPDSDTYDTQRIVKLKEYPANPEKNAYELASTVLTFEQIQAKLAAANALVDERTTTAKIKVSEIIDPTTGVVLPTIGMTPASGYTVSVALDAYKRLGDYMIADIEVSGTIPGNPDYDDFHPRESAVTVATFDGAYTPQRILEGQYSLPGSLYMDGHAVKYVNRSASPVTLTDEPLHAEWVV